jgi:hypothetical protein
VRTCAPWITTLAVFALSLALGGTADAGVYRVHTCNTPDYGRALGPTLGYTPGTLGWIYEQGGVGAVVIDNCALGGEFVLRIESAVTMSAGNFVGFLWTAAPGTRLTAFSLRWNASLANRPSVGEGTARLDLSTDRESIVQAQSPWVTPSNSGGANLMARSVLDAGRFEIKFTCLDICRSRDSPWIVAGVFNAFFDVRDDAAPAGGLVGPSVDARTWSGVTQLALNAVDSGGGLYRAIVELDGAEAMSLPLGSPSECADVGPDPNIREFASAQPCPTRIDGGLLDIDTRKLPQGDHSVRVLLEDASGNRAAVFGPVTRRIDANGAIGPGSDPALRGAANGDGASDLARLTAHWGVRGSRTLLVSRFGRSHVVRGRLRAADGAPIANAAIDMVSKTTAVNARELVKRSGLRTGADGSWLVVLPRGVSSRDVTFRYRSHVNDTIASATASVRLRVRAGVHLAIHPRRARTGQANRFSGRLLGGPMPRGGKQVVLMARASRGGWVRFNVVRTDGRGRFRSVYRFRQPGAALYRFRALSLSEAAYPYLAGGSNVVKVRKR